ncbi:hypothetical protein Tco_1006369 [Tanacetum coccineum]|uniref:Retrotransposon gag domain-containing protein n=1 Tax=Tanacetum coccineum TaxID=301880 RepID=A0ABQ5FHV3_9ASTR
MVSLLATGEHGDATIRNAKNNHTSGTGVRMTERVTQESTYQDLMKCQPMYFKGTEGVVELTQWFERMETVFRISNCSVDNQIKFSTCTLLAGALTWWNSYMKKLEVELWNLKVKGTDVTGYNKRFQELALLCVRMFPEESDKVERYVGMASKLMDKKINTTAERQAENKWKFDDTSKNNQNHLQHNKRQNTGRAYTRDMVIAETVWEDYNSNVPKQLQHNGPPWSRAYLLRVWSLGTLQEGLPETEEQQQQQPWLKMLVLLAEVSTASRVSTASILLVLLAEVSTASRVSTASILLRLLVNKAREDLETLWKLVKAKHGNTRPEEAYEIVIWGDLKVMFEPDVENTVMSDLEDSTVTYTAVSSPFEDRSGIGSPGVVGPPIMPEDPYAYIVAAYQAPPSPDYMPGPEEPQFIGYVPESDSEEEPEADDDEDLEEDPADYPADRNDDDKEEEEPSRDDTDDEDEDKDEGEEEEHPAPADSVLPVERLLALTTPPPSILTPLSSPLPQIPFPLLPASPPASVLPASPPASPIRLLGYRAAMIRLRAKAASTSHSLPLPPPIILSYTRPVAPSSGTPPLHLLSTDHREDRPEICLPPQKRLCPTQGLRYKIGESSAAAAARPIVVHRSGYD